MEKLKQSEEGTKVILIGAIANLILSLFKIAGGIFGKSAAMVADGIHSFSDLLTDIVVLISYKIAQKPADENHPYGHGRAESIGATVVGAIIMLAGLGLAFEASESIAQKSYQAPNVFALIAAIFSILVNEGLFHYTRNIGEKVNSPSIVANAWHHRSDAVSSIAALIGIIGAMVGYPIMDPIAAIVVAILILKVGYDIAFRSIADLMDTGLSEEDTTRLENEINNIPGVIRTHNLRTRKIGADILMDVHVQVDNEASVTEGHLIAESVRRNLISRFSNVQDVLVHVDTEDDTDFEPLYWHNRGELEAKVKPIIDSFQDISKLTRLRTHHHKGHTILEVFLLAENPTDSKMDERLINQLKETLLNLDHVDEVRIFFEFPENLK